jgi:hypothetical protein
MDAERRMFRYVVSVDGQPHVVPLSHSPVAVADAGDPLGQPGVEFWAEHTEGAPQIARAFQVFGTGHPLPDNARWVGTCARTADGLVWHLYEIGMGT